MASSTEQMNSSPAIEKFIDEQLRRLPLDQILQDVIMRCYSSRTGVMHNYNNPCLQSEETVKIINSILARARTTRFNVMAPFSHIGTLITPLQLSMLTTLSPVCENIMCALIEAGANIQDQVPQNATLHDIRGYTVFTFAARMGFMKLLTLLSRQQGYNFVAEWDRCRGSKACMDGFKIRDEDLQALVKKTVHECDKESVEKELSALLTMAQHQGSINKQVEEAHHRGTPVTFSPAAATVSSTTVSTTAAAAMPTAPAVSAVASAASSMTAATSTDTTRPNPS